MADRHHEPFRRSVSPGRRRAPSLLLLARLDRPAPHRRSVPLAVPSRPVPGRRGQPPPAPDPASAAATSRQPSNTLLTAGDHPDSSLKRAFETRCEREKYLHTSPKSDPPTIPGRRSGTGAPTAPARLSRYSAKGTGRSSQTL